MSDKSRTVDGIDRAALNEGMTASEEAWLRGERDPAIVGPLEPLAAGVKVGPGWPQIERGREEAIAKAESNAAALLGRKGGKVGGLTKGASKRRSSEQYKAMAAKSAAARREIRAADRGRDKSHCRRQGGGK